MNSGTQLQLVENFLNIISVSMGLLSILFVALVGFTVKYLSGKGGEKSSQSKFSNLQAEIKKYNNDIFKNSENIDSILEELNILKETQSAITEEQREQIKLSIEESFSRDTAKSILDKIEEKVKEKYILIDNYHYIDDSFQETIVRLKEELFSLSKRGNLNLAIGIITTLFGFSLLGVFVYSTLLVSEQHGLRNIAYEFIPRISLVVLIEVFAYFFLRLYKESLSDIKYFQNEITTIETKCLSLKVALTSGEKEVLNTVISNLASIERNFILDKGQSTIDIERAKVDLQGSDSLIGKITYIISNKNE